MSLGRWRELFLLPVLPLCCSRLWVRLLLFVGMLAWVTRYGLFTFGAPYPSDLWMVLVGVVLHGICYDFFFVTGQIYTDKVAPNAIRGQAQGMLVLFTLGIGMLIGAQVAGKVEVAASPPEAVALNEEIVELDSQIKTKRQELNTYLAEQSEETKVEWADWQTQMA